MLRKIATTVALAVGLGTAGLTALPATADARAFFFFHPFHEHLFFPGPFFFSGPRIVIEHRNRFDSCLWLFVKAEETGSPFWWSRFEDCRDERGFN